MATAESPFLQTVRSDLLVRRERIENVIEHNHSEQLHELLSQVDQALARIDDGTLGVCQVCQGTVEQERILRDPLTAVCLDCLTPNQQRALEYDLELAARIQNGLLPSPDITIPGFELAYHYRPAGVVGGDYCDVIPDDRGGLYFIIADVAGKGVAAAMLTANLRAVMRALVPLNLPLRQMLAQANRLFCESKLPMQYATLVVGHSSAAGATELVNAGHLPALLVRGSHVECFDSNDLPLGMFCDQEFTPVRMELQPQDTLVLFTDGVSEAENPAGEEYGTQALRTLLEQAGLCCPERLVEACRKQVEQFRAGGVRADDETLLAVQFVGAGAGAAVV
ncbi:MAG: PP2C family protein-serine/threonine phosphatase [Candidatus Korobacteraceae bacterium]